MAMITAAEQKAFLVKVNKLIPPNTKILRSITLAQAIVESDWGRSGLTVQGNALFGIRATGSWRGKVWQGTTWEEKPDGTKEIQYGQPFRAYDSWQDSVLDHEAFLVGISRYKAVLGERNYIVAAQALQKAGYATASNYADTLIYNIEIFKLYQFDNAEAINTHHDTTIQLGSKSEMVQALQLRLNALGYRKGIADGNAGAATIDAIKRFQSDNKLTADGICGELTWAALWRWL